MKKFLILSAAILSLVACKEKPNPDEVTEFTISNNQITLVAGKGEQILYLPVEAFNNLTWSSSDETVATVSTSGYVTAISEGTAVITGTLTNNNFTATANVSVESEQDYYIKTTVFDSYVFFNDGGKVYPYPFKNKDGNPLTYGDMLDPVDPNRAELVDSVYEYHFCLLNKNVYLSGDGQMVGEGGLALDYWTSFYYCAQARTVFSLGTYRVENMDTVVNKYDAVDNKGNKYLKFTPPYSIPVSEFDQDLYVDYVTALLNDAQPSEADYPYMGPKNQNVGDGVYNKGARINCYRQYTDGLGSFVYGTLEHGAITMLSREDRTYYADAYILGGRLFGGPDMTGLKLELNEEDGKWYYVVEGEGEDARLVMDELVEYNFEQNVGAPEEEAPKYVPVSVDAFKKQAAVNSAMYIPLRMMLDNNRLTVNR